MPEETDIAEEQVQADVSETDADDILNGANLEEEPTDAPEEDAKQVPEKELKAPAPVVPKDKDKEEPPAEEPQVEQTDEEREADAVKTAEEAALAKQEKEDRALVAEQAKKLREEQAAAAPKPGDKAPSTIFDPDGIMEEIGETLVTDVNDDGEQEQVTMKQWAARYPGIAGAMNAALAAVAKNVETRMGVLEQAEQGRSVESRRAAIFNQLGTEDFGGHTDAQEIVDSQEYSDWVDKQSAGIQGLANDFDANSQNIVIAAYKKAHGITTKDDLTETQKAAIEKQTAKKGKTDKVGKATMRTAPTRTVEPGVDISDAEADAMLKEEQEKYQNG